MNKLLATQTGLCKDLYGSRSLTAQSQKGCTQLKYSLRFLVVPAWSRRQVLGTLKLQQCFNRENVFQFQTSPAGMASSPRCQSYKTFYSRHLRIFKISQSVCSWQAFPARSNVVRKARSLPQSGSTEKCLIRVSAGHPGKHKTWLERPARDKHSSLL